MSSMDAPSGPIPALVAMTVIAGVVGSLWWNTRDDGPDRNQPAQSTAAASGMAAPPAGAAGKR
jgi:hypothetical protein